MRVKILGSAAGGGFPQWNCACRNCRGLREGTLRAKARTQTQLAVSPDNRSWYLLGASPDLTRQIEATPELHARGGIRQTPIEGVVLNTADLDGVLGLLLLRELQPLKVYASPSVRRILVEGNSMFGMLQRIPNQVEWHDIRAGTPFCLGGIQCEPLALSDRLPAYVSGRSPDAVLGLSLGALTFMPVVGTADSAWIERAQSCDLLLFDGTFWTDDELIRIQGGGSTARRMGHLPVSGPGGSLELLAGVKRPRKIFLHINNTNPMLDEDSPERARVRDLGWEIAEDGMEFEA